MCKITILYYTQCNCNARFGTIGEGLIVTKEWHNRLPLDQDAVPFERCLQAKSYALSASQSSTMEFSRCHNIQFRSVQVREEACYRCLMFRRSNEKAEKARTLIAEHKFFTDRYKAAAQSAAKDADVTRNLWQTIKELPRYDVGTEEQKFIGTKENLRSTKFGSIKKTVADWEDRLEMQIAHQEMGKEKKTEKKVARASGEEKKQEKKERQTKLACLQHRLVQANKRVISPALEENEKPPPEYEEMEQNPRVRETPPRRLRIARLTKRSHSGTGPTLDMMVSAQLVQTVYEADPLQNGSASPETSSPDVSTSHSSGDPSVDNTVARYHTTGPSTVININPPVEDLPIRDTAHPAVTFASLRGFTALSAEAPEFRPFQRAPPTEPRMLRAPTAPRAMREGTCGSQPRTTWQPGQYFATVRGYATVRGWRQ